MFLRKIFYSIKFILIFVAATLILSNCKSTAQKENSEEKDTIMALRKSFSPNNDGILDKQTFKFNVYTSNSNQIESWILDVRDLKDSVVFDKSDNNRIPKEFVWDGKDNNKSVLADGVYTASLLVYYKNGTSTIGKSTAFFLDTVPPDIRVKTDKDFFTPDNDGKDDVMDLTFISAKDLSGIKNWKMSIFDPVDNSEFSSVSGQGPPSGSYYWNGASSDGKIIVESATDYPIKLIADDFAGNSSTTDLFPISIGILVNRMEDGRFHIRISNIKFEPDTTVMTKDEKNNRILNILADAFVKYPDYKIVVEGYSNKWKKGLSEDIAYGLSVDRAKLIVNELVNRGVKKGNMIVKGKGFEDPIVPLKIEMTIEETESMKINRRVEFYRQR